MRVIATPDVIGFGDSSHPDPAPQGMLACMKLRAAGTDRYAPPRRSARPRRDGQVRRSDRVNEYAAKVVQDRPDRFSFFATLCLPNVQGSLRERAHAFTGMYEGYPVDRAKRASIDRGAAELLFRRLQSASRSP